MELDGSRKSLDFYSRHGFVRPSPEGTPSSKGEVAVLSGDREAGLRAMRALTQEGASIGAVGMNLMGRLLHDVGDLQGAVDAYLKALEASSKCWIMPLAKFCFDGMLTTQTFES